LALLVQTVLGLLSPTAARVLDPFLILTVYCGLVGGPSHGMLAGAAAGWVQDVHFGGPILGLSGLTRTLIGFTVGVGTARFHLGEPLARVLVLMVATLADALLLRWLAGAFDVQTASLSPLGLLLRSGVTAAAGLVLFETVDRRIRPRVMA
ncbi:MAG TPA: rod shape-determining protein MreD, partial [Vicinamibacteria bacterium]|nr:rod shape-determining protein MreD [Vicinamibacteria bacterium]